MDGFTDYYTNGKPLQCSCLENPRDGGAWWAAVYGVAQSRTQLKRLSVHTCIGEGTGNPLQYSCLENCVDRGSWWADVCGVAQSRTRLRRLSSSSGRKIFRKKEKTNTTRIGTRVFPVFFFSECLFLFSNFVYLY